jgi:hypothetical protein
MRGFGVLGILFLSFILIMSLKQTLRPTSVTLQSEEQRRNGPCPGETKTIAMKDAQMPKLFPVGSQFRVLTNWYSCHQVERGDLIYLRYSFKLDSVVRKVYGIPGDKFEVIKDTVHKAWGLSINGERVSDPDGASHFFGNENPPLLSLYTSKGNKGTLGSKNYIVFSEKSPSASDSGTLGLVNSDDFLGKIEHP